MIKLKDESIKDYQKSPYKNENMNKNCIKFTNHFFSLRRVKI